MLLKQAKCSKIYKKSPTIIPEVNVTNSQSSHPKLMMKKSFAINVGQASLTPRFSVRFSSKFCCQNIFTLK